MKWTHQEYFQIQMSLLVDHYTNVVKENANTFLLKKQKILKFKIYC